jgi:hypothetical protein
MSVESTALERSKLEQKDRAELAAIVDAMGGKAGSRAKKADLVDQSLTLAGVSGPAEPANGTPRRGGGNGSGNGSGSGGETTGDAAVDAAGDATGDAPAAAEPTRPADTGPSLPEPEVIIPAGVVAADDEAPAEWETAYGGDDAEPAASTDAPGAGGAESDRGTGGESRGERGERQPRGERQSGQSGQGGQGNGQ